MSLKSTVAHLVRSISINDDLYVTLLGNKIYGKDRGVFCVEVDEADYPGIILPHKEAAKFLSWKNLSFEMGASELKVEGKSGNNKRSMTTRISARSQEGIAGGVYEVSDPPKKCFKVPADILELALKFKGLVPIDYKKDRSAYCGFFPHPTDSTKNGYYTAGNARHSFVMESPSKIKESVSFVGDIVFADLYKESTVYKSVENIGDTYRHFTYLEGMNSFCTYKAKIPVPTYSTVPTKSLTLYDTRDTLPYEAEIDINIADFITGLAELRAELKDVSHFTVNTEGSSIKTTAYHRLNKGNASTHTEYPTELPIFSMNTELQGIEGYKKVKDTDMGRVKLRVVSPAKGRILFIDTESLSYIGIYKRLN